jgi:hypothetical protein
MPSGKVIGGVAALVFAILTGVFAWLADRESGDTESKKYKGFYAGSVVCGLLFIVSLLYAIYSAFMDAPLEVQEPPEAVVAPEALQKLDEADAILAGAPNKQSIVAKALKGNANGAQADAIALGEAGALAKAAASTAAEEAARVAEQAAATQSAASENAVKAAEVAAAKAAESQAATNAAKVLAVRAENASAAKKTATATVVGATAAAKAIETKAAGTVNTAKRLGLVAGIAR